MRLSEVLLEWIEESIWLVAQEKLQRLARDGDLEVHGRFNDDYTAAENRSGEWEIIPQEILIRAEWDWMKSELRFDPNDVPEGFGASYMCYVDVSFYADQLAEVLATPRINKAAPKSPRRGKPEQYQWSMIELAASQLATEQHLSANKFYAALFEKLNSQNLESPSISSMKSRPAIKKIADQFSQK